MWRFWLALLCMFAGSAVDAVERVRVLALFPGKAMLEVDGKRRVFGEGDKALGVRLVEANPSFALVEFDGRSERLGLGSAVSATYEPRERREVRILQSSSGSYFVNGLINGQPVQFLVDTGASRIAMSESHAARLGIRHRLEGQPNRVSTASGIAVAHNVQLDSVSIEGVRLTDVAAAVIEGDGPPYVLLGMTALQEFEIEQKENLLILRSRF